MEASSGQRVDSRQLAEHEPQRVRRVELVVAVRRDSQSRHGLDPATHDPDHVERRFVRPVQILQDDERRSPGCQLVHERSCDLVGFRPGLHEPCELATRQPDDVQQRSERARCEQRITRPPHDARRARLVFAEAPQQRRLADSCLTSDEREVSVTLVPDCGHQRAQSCELALSLEELHRTLG